MNILFISVLDLCQLLTKGEEFPHNPYVVANGKGADGHSPRERRMDERAQLSLHQQQRNVKAKDMKVYNCTRE